MTGILILYYTDHEYFGFYSFVTPITFKKLRYLKYLFYSYVKEKLVCIPLPEV
jgi:hypothetical protein